MAGRRFLISLAACATIAAASVVIVIDRATEAIVRAIEWMLSAFKPEPMLFRIDGDYEPSPAFAAFSDPHVDRHEARTACRAAPRHV